MASAPFFGFIQKIGMPRIERWDEGADEAPAPRPGRSGAVRCRSPADPRFDEVITTFRVDGEGQGAGNALWKKKCVCRPSPMSAGVRLSAHLYVSPADVDATDYDLGNRCAGERQDLRVAQHTPRSARSARYWKISTRRS